MDVTLHQLRLLTQVRTHGTVSAAAAAMRCTPSAASQQLSALEAVVGSPVVQRLGRGVQLTDAGHALVRHADLILKHLEAARADMEQMRGDIVGTLRVGVLESLTSRVLPDLLTVLRDRHPDLTPKTFQVESFAHQRILSGELDGAFVVDYPAAPTRRDQGISHHFVCRDWFHIVVPADDPLTEPTSPLGALEGRPMISSSERQECGRCVASACRSAGFEPKVMHEVDNYPSVLNLVAAGAGVALVPGLGLLNVPDGVRLIEPVGGFCRHVEFAFRESGAERPSLQAFLAGLDDVAEEAGLDRCQNERRSEKSSPRSPWVVPA